MPRPLPALARELWSQEQAGVPSKNPREHGRGHRLDGPGRSCWSRAVVQSGRGRPCPLLLLPPVCLWECLRKGPCPRGEAEGRESRGNASAQKREALSWTGAAGGALRRTGSSLSPTALSAGWGKVRRHWTGYPS